MTARITFFPVDNGDMALLEFESGRKLLIDVHIRAKADDDDDETPDVAGMLKDRLNKDADGRLYVDGFLLSHPDEDHCLGLDEHFHLGPPSEFPKGSDKILIREIWSSPIVFRRASKNHTLCPDAKAFNTEAKRRVAKWRDSANTVSDGDRIQILGADKDGKTDDLAAILVEVDQLVTKLNGSTDGTFSARLLAPLVAGDNDEEELLTKNQSSTILRFSIAGGNVADKARYLTGGDAEVAVWERLWSRNKDRKDWLQYHILLTPHHCSWHSLSYDSWSEHGEKAKLNADARNSLSQALSKATLVSSSKPISDDDSDPPCVRAKREYEEIADDADGEFVCVMEHPSLDDPSVLEFEIDGDGPKKRGNSSSGSATPASFAIGGSKPRQVEKKGGGRYA